MNIAATKMRRMAPLTAPTRFGEPGAHTIAEVASASLLEIWIDEAEQRTRFLFEAGRKPGARA